MSCDVARTILHGYLDGELDAVRAAEFERHLENCHECMTTLDAQESLRSSLRHSVLYERAPASLRQKIRADLHAAPGVAAVPLPSHYPANWRLFAVAASFLILIFVGWRVLSSLRGNDDKAVLTAEIVDAHLRSLQLNHLTDVASTDQHTVKPWFDGKLDFSPPVRDFAAQGFPLLGGRIDVLHARTVAALVYGRRKHVINVFVWPAREPDAAPRSGTNLGYHWIDWRKGGMEVYAISDVAANDLDAFAQLFTE